MLERRTFQTTKHGSRTSRTSVMMLIADIKVWRDSRLRQLPSKSHGFGRAHWKASVKIDDTAHPTMSASRPRPARRLYPSANRPCIRRPRDIFAQAIVAMRSIWEAYWDFWYASNSPFEMVFLLLPSPLSSASWTNTLCINPRI
jgi:hypothetical protein